MTALGLGGETGHGPSQGQRRSGGVETQPFGHHGGPEGEKGRTIDSDPIQHHRDSTTPPAKAAGDEPATAGALIRPEMGQRADRPIQVPGGHPNAEVATAPKPRASTLGAGVAYEWGQSCRAILRSKQGAGGVVGSVPLPGGRGGGSAAGAVPGEQVSSSAAPPL
jgi:hypothetical protein